MQDKNMELCTALWKRGFRQLDLAKKLRVDPAVVCRIVNGRIQPSPSRQAEIAKILKVPAAKLFPEN